MREKLSIDTFAALAPIRAAKSAHEGSWSKDVKHPVITALKSSMTCERQAAKELRELVKQGNIPEALLRLGAINGLFFGDGYDSYRALGIADGSDRTWIYIGGAVQVKKVG